MEAYREIERHSSTWKAVTAWIQAEIDKARDANDAPGLGPEETEALRSRIATLREVLTLADPPEKVEIEPDRDYGLATNIED